MGEIENSGEEQECRKKTKKEREVKNMKKIAVVLLIMCMLIASTVNAFAASGTVKYRCEKNHVLLVPLDVVTSVGTTIKLNADFEYTASDTQSRTYTTEEYFMTAESINAPSVTSELSFSMGVLQVYPKNASVKKCTKSYTPSVFLPSGLLYHAEAGSKTKLSILKSGNSYGKLGYSIAGNVVLAQSGQATFNNLGVATGTVTAQANSDVVMRTDDSETITSTDSMEKLDNLVTGIKEKVKQNPENYEAKIAEEYRGILGEANKQNIAVPDEEVDSYIKELFVIYENAENKAEIDRICKDAGTTYEEIVIREYEGYRTILTEAKLFNKFTQEHYGKDIQLYAMDTEIQKEQLLHKWNKYVETLNAMYS